MSHLPETHLRHMRHTCDIFILPPTSSCHVVLPYPLGFWCRTYLRHIVRIASFCLSLRSFGLGTGDKCVRTCRFAPSSWGQETSVYVPVASLLRSGETSPLELSLRSFETRGTSPHPPPLSPVPGRIQRKHRGEKSTGGKCAR